MNYKISHSLEAQYKEELGTDIYISISGFPAERDVVTIKIRANINDEVHFNKIRFALERALKKQLQGLNLNV